MPGQIQVKLNLDSKTFMCFIGNPQKDKGQIVYFTMDDPGPKPFDLDTLSDEKRRQLIYNLQRGILLVDNKDALFSAVKASKEEVKWSPPAEVLQVAPVQKLVRDENTALKMKDFLNQHHATIKRKLPELSLREARVAIDLEKLGRERKSVVEILKKYIDGKIAKQKAVPLFVGGDVPADSLVIQGDKLSTQVGDVVESDIEEVILVPPDQDI